MLNKHILDFLGINILATSDDHILFAIDYVEITIFIKAGHITRAEPTIFKKPLHFIRFIIIA